jgi:NAD(P)-dependent dehydrogenase (short-subunit alcohol dehydrogenase family)
MNDQADTTSARVGVVTGATGMLGRATAIELAARGADVVLLCRDPTRGAAVLEEVGKAGPGGSRRPAPRPDPHRRRPDPGPSAQPGRP